MADRTVRVRLVADVAQYRREIANASQQTKDLRSATQEVGSGLQRAGAGMVVAGGLMAAGLYKAGRAAADLEQSVGSTEAVFHDASGTIDAFADDAATAMGLSERAFRDATTEIGGALRRNGVDIDTAAAKAIELTQVGADLAATYGGTTAEAVHALGRAFAGEADPAERFNLDLRISNVNAKAVALGLAESEASVSSYARAQALMALIMEQSADAQGQFARETDTANGQMAIASAEFENFQANVGRVIAPILADLAGLLGSVADGFSNLPPGVQDTISKLALAASGIAVFSGAASFAVGTVMKLRDGFAAVSATLSGGAGLVRNLSGLALAASPAVAGIGLFAGALVNAANDSSRTRDRIEGLADGIREFGSVVDSVASRLQAGELFDWDNLGLGAAEFNSILEDVGITVDDLVNDNLSDLILQLRTQGEAMGLAEGDIDRMARAFQLLRGEIREANAQAATTEAVMGEVEGATEDLTGATDDATDAYEANERAIEEWSDAVRDAPGLVIDLERATLDAEQALRDYDTALHDAEASQDDIDRALLDVKDSFIRLGEAAFNSAHAQEVGAGRAATAQQAATASQIWELGRVAGSLAPGSSLRVWLDQYIATLAKAQGTFTATLVVREASPGAGRITQTPRQHGGYIPGSGSGDIVPIMAEPGEFMIRKKAAAALGPSALYKLNRADTMGLASGGYAGAPATWSGPMSSLRAGVIHLTVEIDRHAFIDTMVAYNQTDGPVPITVKAVA